MGCAATGLVERDGAVRGVSVQTVDGTEHDMEALLVVGTDGRDSIFFDGIGDDIEVSARSPRHQQDAVVERSLAQIEDRKVRAALRTLVRALART